MNRRRRAHFLVVGAAMLLLSLPVHSGGGKGGGGKQDKTQYDFVVQFRGADALLENAPGGVWYLSSAVGGHNNVGASPVFIDPEYLTQEWMTVVDEKIAAIGDQVCPCEGEGQVVCGECGNRLADAVGEMDLKAETLKFLGENQWLPGTDVNHRLFFRFTATDPADATEYLYTVTPYGVGDYVDHPWEPTDPSFCVPIDFTHVKVWQTGPVIKKRQRVCSEDILWATCEAREDEPLIETFPAGFDFGVTIWRAEVEWDGVNPPCS